MGFNKINEANKGLPAYIFVLNLINIKQIYTKSLLSTYKSDLAWRRGMIRIICNNPIEITSFVII